MKCYSVPASVPEYSFQHDNWQEYETKYIEQVKTALLGMGYNGEHTGKIFRSPIADGHASYMVMHKGTTFALVFLPLGDAYSIPDAHMRGLRKSDVMQYIKRVDMFAKA